MLRAVREVTSVGGGCGRHTGRSSGQRTRGHGDKRPDRGPPVNSLHCRGSSACLVNTALHPTLLGSQFYANSPPSARNQFQQGNQSRSFHFMTNVNN